MEVICKKKSKGMAINELIGNRLASIYGLLCPFYYVMPDEIDPPFYYIFSKRIEEMGQFKKICTRLELSTLYSVWDYLEEEEYDPEKLMPQVVRMYIFDVIFGNSDRSKSNWGIVRIDGEDYVVIYDHENLFSKNYPVYISSDYDEIRFGRWGDEEYAFANRMAEIENFFKQSTSEDQALFTELLLRVTPESFAKILEDIETENNLVIEDKAKRVAFYRVNFEAIRKITEDFRGWSK